MTRRLFPTLFLAVRRRSGLRRAADGNRLTYLDEPIPTTSAGRSRSSSRRSGSARRASRRSSSWPSTTCATRTSTRRSSGRSSTGSRRSTAGRPVSIMTCQVDPERPALADVAQGGAQPGDAHARPPLPALQGRRLRQGQGDLRPLRRPDERGPEQPAGRVPHALLRLAEHAQPAVLRRDLQQDDAAGPLPDDRLLVFNILTAERPGAAARPGARPRRPRAVPQVPAVRPSFVNTIEDYPYPYVIGRLCWEFPCVVAERLGGATPAQAEQPADGRATGRRRSTATVIKQGVFNLVFHPHGWIKNEQVVELIDHAVKQARQEGQVPELPRGPGAAGQEPARRAAAARRRRGRQRRAPARLEQRRLSRRGDRQRPIASRRGSGPPEEWQLGRRATFPRLVVTSETSGRRRQYDSASFDPNGQAVRPRADRHSLRRGWHFDRRRWVADRALELERSDHRSGPTAGRQAGARSGRAPARPRRRRPLRVDRRQRSAERGLSLVDDDAQVDCGLPLRLAGRGVG